MYKVEQINIFPLKSATGLALDEAQLGPRGFVWDRNWMLVDIDGKFLTQRQLPKMTLIKTQLDDGQLVLTAPGMKPLALPLLPEGEVMPVVIWEDKVNARLVSDEANLWCSQFLQTTCYLVAMPSDEARIVDQTFAQAEDETGFADGFPLLLISTASLDDLNSRLEEKVPMIRFRPNLVVSGCQAYEEDQWNQIKVGDVEFRVVKPCSRCVIPTVDPATGLKHKNTEPLRTLSSFRKGEDGKVYFGQNIIHDQQGIIRLGDSVEVIC